MKKHLTLQTASAFERIQDALLGKTDDDLSFLILNLEELVSKAKKIQEVFSCLSSGDC